LSTTTSPNRCQDGAILHVLSGPHAGSLVELLSGSTTVGADSGNDVVLADPSLALFHFALDRTEAATRLFATGGPVQLRAATLRPGSSASCREGMMLQAGGTTFRLTGIAPPPRSVRTSRPAMFAAGIACAAIALGFLAMQAAGGADATSPPPLPAGVPVRPAAAIDRLAAAFAALRERLAAADLGSIALSMLADGSVAARGAIMPQQMAAWRDAQHWFDGAYGASAVLVNQVTAAATTAPLSIQAVWPGVNPYVIDGSGQKLFAGATLPSGWTLERIQPDRVVVGRGGQTLSVRF